MEAILVIINNLQHLWDETESLSSYMHTGYVDITDNPIKEGVVEVTTSNC